MKPRRQPRLATWLIQHFGCGPDNEVVIGDLAERYQNGETRTWYWSQTIVAIVVSVFSDIRRHKLLALRAVIVGWFVFGILSTSMVLSTVRLSESWPPNWLYYPMTSSPPVSWLPLEWLQWDKFVSIYWHAFTALIFAAIYLAGIVSGWIVGRLHRRQRSLVLIHAAAISLFGVIQGIIFGTENSVGGPFPYFPLNVAMLALFILIGGLPMTNRQRSESIAGDPE